MGNKKKRRLGESEVLDLTQGSDSDSDAGLVPDLDSPSKSHAKDNSSQKMSCAQVSLKKLPAAISPLKAYTLLSGAEAISALNSPRKEQVAHGKPETTKGGKKKSSKGTSSTARKLKAFGNIFQIEGEALLDQTADFSSGCTPFKSVAEKVVRKSKLGRKAVKLRQRTKLSDPCSSDASVSTDRRTSPRKDVSGGSSEGAPLVGTGDCSAGAQQVTATVEHDTEWPDNNAGSSKCGDVDDDPAQLAGPECEPAPACEAEKPCHLCGKQVAHSLAKQHLRQCLKSKYQRGKSAGNDQAKTGYFPCQICQLDITDLSLEQRHVHLNQCMDGGATSSSASATGHKADQPGERQKEEVEEQMGDGEEEEDISCQMCHKKLGHLNSQRRTQHVNRCADKVEADAKQEHEQAQAMVAARNRVLDCPLCGQKLKTLTSRQAHLKKCAAKYHVPTSTLMKRVKEQEEEYTLQLEAGVVPQEARPTRRKKHEGGVTVRLVGASLSSIDEDTQLALALSTSLQEHKHRDSLAEFNIQPQSSTSTAAGQGSEVTERPEVTERSEVKDAFSILMTPTKPKDKRGGRKKKELREVPSQLLLQTSQERKSKLAKKVATVILPSGSQDASVSCTPTFPQSRAGQKYRPRQYVDSDAGTEAKCCRLLWSRLSSISDASRSEFYVPALDPAITPSTMVVGSNIKQMSAIPGWNSVDSPAGQSVPQAAQSATPVDLTQMTMNESLLVASTQTAVVLAELAGDVTLNQTAAAPANQMPESRGQKEVRGHDIMDATLREEPSGFVASTLQNDQLIDQLLNDLEKMVDNPALSDLTVKVKQGQMVHAHKFILAARCPRLAKAVGSGTEVTLEKHSKAAIVAMLKYLYAGNTDIPTAVVFEVKTLSERFQLQGLQTACSELIETHNLSEHPDRQVSDPSPQGVDRDLQELLKQAWGSDSELDTSQDEGEDGPDKDGQTAAENEQMDEEIEELYEFMATQRQRKVHRPDDVHEEQAGTPMLEQSLLLPASAERLQKMSDVEVLAKITQQGGIDVISQALLGDIQVRGQSESEAGTDSEAEGDSETDAALLCDPHEERSSNEAFPEAAPYQTYPDDDLCPALSDSNMSEELSLTCNFQAQQNDCQNVLPMDTEYGAIGAEESAKHTTTRAGRGQQGPYTPGDDNSVDSTERAIIVTTPDLFVPTQQQQQSASSDHDEKSVSCSPPGHSPLGQARGQRSCFQLEESIKSDQNQNSIDLTRDDSSGSDLELFPSPDADDVPVPEDSGGEVGLADDSGSARSTPSPTFPSLKPSARSAEPVVDLTSLMLNKSLAAKAQYPMDVTSSHCRGDDDRQAVVAPGGKKKRKRSYCSSDSSEEGAMNASSKRQRYTSIPLSPHASSQLHSAAHTMPEEEPAEQGVRDDVRDDVNLQMSLSYSEEADDVMLLYSGQPVNATEDVPVIPDEAAEIIDVDAEAVEDPVILDDQDHVVAAEDEADVWDGFDDAGDHLIGFDMMTQPSGSSAPTSQNAVGPRSSCQSSSASPQEAAPVQKAAEGPTATSVPSDEECDYDPPTDVDTDISLLLHDANRSLVCSGRDPTPEKMVTPQQATERAKKKHLREWVPPSPFTPMPAYERMITPNLKKECQKFGVRALPKKKMIVALKHIYHGTHQYETDSEFDGSFQEPSDTASVATRRISLSQPCRPKPDPPIIADKPKVSRKPRARVQKSLTGGQAPVHHGKGKSVARKAAVHDVSSSESDQASACSDSQEESEVADLPEESILVSPSKVAGKKRDVLAKKQAIRDLINSNEELTLKILHYEPLEFDEFHQLLKESGCGDIGAAVVADCLDELNVCFTMRAKTKTTGQAGKSRRRRRKPKK